MDKITEGNRVIDGVANLQVRGTYLFEFKNLSQWLNKAPSWFKPYKYGHSLICLDKRNNVCHIGEDFMVAKDNDLFPVKVYSLERTSKVSTPLNTQNNLTNGK